MESSVIRNMRLILCGLSRNRYKTTDIIAARLRLATSTVSRYLRILWKAGLVKDIVVQHQHGSVAWKLTPSLDALGMEGFRNIATKALEQYQSGH